MGTSTSGSAASIAIGTKGAGTAATPLVSAKSAGHALAVLPGGSLHLLTKGSAHLGRALFHAYAQGRAFGRTAMGKAVFAGLAAGLMLISGVGISPFNSHHPSIQQAAAVSTLPQVGPAFFPYVVPPSLFSLPSGVSIPGNASLPKLASAVIGAQPIFALLSVEPWKGGSLLIIQQGLYEPSLANGTICSGVDRDHSSVNAVGDGNLCKPRCSFEMSTQGSPVGSAPRDCGLGNDGGAGFDGPPGHERGCSDHSEGSAKASPTSESLCLPSPANSTQPILFGGPIVIATFLTAIDGDALAANGSSFAAAASTQGVTSVFYAPTAGGLWSSLGSAPGSAPNVALGGGLVVSTSIVPGSALEIGSFPVNQSAPAVASEPPALNATPVVFQTGEVGAVASLPNASLAFYSSPAVGQPFASQWLAGFAPESTSPLFDSIGSTKLAVPGGIPGQLTAVSSGSDVFALWTTSVNGRVVPVEAASGDGGHTWVGPYSCPGPLGAIEDPSAVISPVGYVYVTWRDDAIGTWQVDQSVFDLDARTVEPPTPLPMGVGPGQLSAGAPTVAVDELERPGYAWSVQTLNGTEILFTSGHLAPVPALAEMRLAISKLAPSDFNTSVNASAAKSYLLNLTGELLNASARLTSLGPQASRIASEVESVLYPNVTSLPLNLLCSNVNSSCLYTMNSSTRSPSLIANETGPFVANKYLAVYADWVLEALGVGVLAPVPDDPVACTGTDCISVSQVALNPITGRLDSTSSVHEFVNGGHILEYCNGVKKYASASYTYIPYSYQATVSASVPGGSTVTLVGPTNGNGAKSFYLGQIPLGDSVSWSETEKITFEQYASITDACTGKKSTTGPITGLSPETIGPATGTLSPISLSFAPAQPVIQISGTPSGGIVLGGLSLHWNNSMLAVAQSTLKDLGTGQYLHPQNPSSAAVTEEDLYFTGVFAQSYLVSATIASEPGSTPSGSNVVDLGGSSSSAGITSSWSATISVPLFPGVQTGNNGVPSVTSLTSSSAVLDWQEYPYYLPSSQGLIVSASYQETGGFFQSVPVPASQIAFGNCVAFANRYLCYSTIQLQGLMGLTNYAVYVSAEFVESTFTVSVVLPITFETQGSFTFEEADLPYDSVSRVGGGANIQWYSAGVSRQLGNVGVFVDGDALYIVQSSTPAYYHVPIEGLESVPQTPGNSQLNLSAGLVPNTPVTLSIVLNYTEYGNPVQFVAYPSTFTYLLDTSGDGLSDAEKVQGWGVTYTSLTGSTVNEQVVANYQDVATNGLVNDFLEKRFGLDPRTVDTAGSHMLDTWNLTFDLGSNSVPSGFQAWQEAGAGFDPFQYAQIPNTGAVAPGDPTGSTPGNFTDDSAWSSNQLWSYSDLQALNTLVVNEDVGWLRAVTGNLANGHEVLTVWGKLSWGANPLSTSTPNDGMADGSRVNPLYEQYLMVGLTNFHFGGGVFIQPNGLSDCNGFAARYWVNQSSQTGTPVLQAYSSEGFAYADVNGCPGQSPDISNQFYTIPVPQQTQVEHLDIQELVNTATCTPSYLNEPNPCSNNNDAFKLEQVPINSCGISYSLSVDMVVPPSPYNGNGYARVLLQGTSGCSNEPQAYGTITLGVTAVAGGGKAPTFLWVPNDNSTLSNLPQGLQRYTGEQNFVLVAADVHLVPDQNGVYFGQTSLTSDPITDPWGNPSYLSTYQLNLGMGMNNFLIPRSQFLASPMGQAILENTNIDPNQKDNGPFGYGQTTNLLSGTEGGAVLDNFNQGNVGLLSCYWQNRAITSNSGITSACNGYGTGTPTDDPNFQDVAVDYNDNTGCTGINCGGVPSNPNEVPASLQSAAVQAVVTVHLTCSQATAAGCAVKAVDAPTLDALLAGLLYNGQGGTTGYFQDVTHQLPSLSLLPVVMQALATSSEPNGGVFGAPISFAQPAPPAPPGCSSMFSCVWNTVSGALLEIGQTIVNGLVGLAGAVWNAAIAAASYVNGLTGGALGRVMNGIANAAAHDLYTVGQALATLLANLLAYLIAAIQAFMTDAFSVAWKDVSVGISGILNLANQASSDALHMSQGGGDLANTINSESNLLAPFLLMGGAVATLLTIAYGISAPVSFSSSALIVLLIGVMFTAIGEALPSGGSGLLGQVQSVLTGVLSLAIGGIVSLGEGLFNLTESLFGSGLTSAGMGFIGDPIFDVMGLVGMAMGIGGLVSAALLGVKQNFDSGFWPGILMGAGGFGLGFGLFVLFSLNSNGCNYVGSGPWNSYHDMALGEFWLSVLGLLLSAVTIRGALKASIPLALAGVGFGVAGIYFAQLDIDTLDACKSTNQ